MDSEEKEDILAAIFINIINMVNAFTMVHLPTFKYTLSFLYEIFASQKDVRNILLWQANHKYKVVKRKPVIGYNSRSSCPEVFF